MNMKKTIIIGGDERQKELYTLFKDKNKNCAAVFENGELQNNLPLLDFDAVILPLPCSKDGKTVFSAGNKLDLELSAVLEGVKKGTVLIGGNFSDSFRLAAEEKEAKIFDLFAEKDFALYNAYLTAQGAVRLLLENTKEYVVSLPALVTGFGKIGKATGLFLRSLGLDVYVFARRSEARLEARALGFKTITQNELSFCVHLFSFIFNTVPSRLFEKEDISHMKRGAVYFELASRPFGADEKDFEIEDAAFVFGGGLPGKFCPLSSAKEIEKRINKYLETQGDFLE